MSFSAGFNILQLTSDDELLMRSLLGMFGNASAKHRPTALINPVQTTCGNFWRATPSLRSLR